MLVLARAWYLRVRGVLHCPGVASMASSRGVSHDASVAAALARQGEHAACKAHVDGIKLNEALREFGEKTQCMHQWILQRNAVDGAQNKGCNPGDKAR